MKLDKNFKIEITRGSGPGSQHKNKVETCVKITHLPTGITETCQDSRSKQRNLLLSKERILKKLEELEKTKKQEEQNNTRLEKIKNPSRVRTYDFKAKKVFDNRTKKQYDLDRILNGELNLMYK